MWLLRLTFQSSAGPAAERSHETVRPLSLPVVLVSSAATVSAILSRCPSAVSIDAVGKVRFVPHALD